jgi:hypothetical protein
VNIGDVVKRREYAESDPWITERERNELGIIVRFEKARSIDVLVLWSQIGLSWEHPDDICVQIE